jgi:hypothetical protein
MATTKMNYDHPVYLTPVIYSGSSTVGASGVTTKWAAYTAMKIYSVTYSTNIASTSSTTPLLYSKSGTATATTTLTAVSSAATSANNYALATALSLAQGDQFWVAHGTDATVSLSVAVEARVVPGSTITAV